MSTTIVLATADGHIRSTSTSYSSASAGSGALTVDAGGSVWRVGQNKVGSTYELYETFLQFPYTLDTNSKVVTAYVDLDGVITYGAGVDRSLAMREYDWGGTLETADWRNPLTQLEALNRVGTVGHVNQADDNHVYVTQGLLNESLDTTGTKRYVVYNSRMSGNDVPAGAELNEFHSAESASSDPALVYTTVPKHVLLRVAGCETMLSDGQHVYIEASDGNDSPSTLTLKRYDGTTHTNIATNLLSGRNMGFSNQSLQQFALVRDASDNIYWIGHATGLGNTLNVVAWKKTGTNTWSEQSGRQADMPSGGFDTVINNIGAAWHNVGTAGTIMVIVARECISTDGDGDGEMAYALLSCNYLLNGSGSLLRASGDAYTAGLISHSSNGDDFNQPVNPVGTGLDVVALPNSTTRGVVVCLDRASEVGNYAPIGIVRYILNSTGTGISQTNDATQDLWSTKDGGAKARVLPISDTRFAIITVDKDTGWGPTIYVIQNIGTSSTFSTLGSVRLSEQSISTLPAPSALHDKPTWDAVYLPAANSIYFYYIDQGDADRLMRTTFSLANYLANLDQIQVANGTGVAPAGATVHALRVDRGTLTKSEVMVSVASKTGSTQHGTLYVKDTLNVAPTAPTLTDKANYDATSSNLFDWTFNDPNVGDTQSAFQLIIENADTGASVHDTGKITSAVSDRTVAGGTLTNGNNYRWKVRTYDAADAVSPYSSYDFFSTTVTGSTTITAPATDNPAGVTTDDYLVQWTVSGSTQAAYMVKVVRTVTGATHSDTGWVTSVATSHTISGMLSGVEYRIEVTTRNASSVATNTATRLITPTFNMPETPVVSVEAVVEGGHVLVDITNPPPGSFSPPVLDNFETDTTANYTTVGGGLVWDTAQFHDGARSLKLTVSGSPTTARIWQNSSNDYPVIGGKTYIVRFWARSIDGHSNLAAAIDWRDAAHASISIAPGTATAIATGAWEQRTATLLAPLTAKFAAFGPALGASPPNGEILHIDELELLEATDQPEVSSNHVQRRKLGDTLWTTVATVPLNGAYEDYHVGSGDTYEYQVLGVASSGVSTSAVQEVTLVLEGVWLHVPSNPSETAINLRYGANQRGDTLDTHPALTHYAGREDPLADFPHYISETFSATVDVPYGDDYHTQLKALDDLIRSRQTLVYRDNRRRFAFGIIGGPRSRSDTAIGTQVTFDFTRVDYNEAVA